MTEKSTFDEMVRFAWAHVVTGKFSDMFDHNVRRHPVQTFQFWFVVLTCFVTVTAWKLDLFSFPQAPLPVVSDEPMPPPPQDSGYDSGTALLAPQQSEEASLQEPGMLPAEDRELALLTTPEPEVATAETPAPVPRLIQTASAVQTEKTQSVIHAAAVSMNSTPSVVEPLKPVETSAPKELDLTETEALIAKGDDVGALRILSSLYWKQPESRSEMMTQLNYLARKVYFSPEPHYLPPYTVEFGDRLETVARKYQLSREYLAKLNRLDGGPLRAGQSLKVIQGPFSAVLSKSGLELTIHCQGYYITAFPVGLGNDCSLPEGKYSITDKVSDPDYYGENGIISHNDPANPLGTRWLTFNDEQRTLQAYGLHGTADSELVGKMEGPGCVRLQQRDIEMVYDILTVGSELVIHR